MKVERLTYADHLFIKGSEYTKAHGIIEAYGGRIKDCQYNWTTGEMIMFFEMAKTQHDEFQKELKEENII